MFNYIARLLASLFDFIVGLFKMSKKHQQHDYSFKIFECEEVKPNKKHKRSIPFPRSGHRIVADSQNLYSFGGYNPLYPCYAVTLIDNDESPVNTYPLFRELWKFNYASKVWTPFNNQKSLPHELASNAVIRNGNILMVYGGTGAPFGQRCSNQLYVCNLSSTTNKMCEINTMGQQPLPQYGQALVYHNGFLYTIGGTTGYEYTCDVHRLNLKTLVWESVYVCQGKGEYEPEGRYRHEVAFDGKNIYVLGGGTSVEAFDFRDIPSFNVERKEWFQQKTKKDPSLVLGAPASRRCHGAVQINTHSSIQVFVMGGYDGEDVFNDLWRLDLTTFQWTLISNSILPRPTYFHSTAVSPEGKLYIFGGIYLSEEVRRSNRIFSAWLCIPKLSEMCWEAILHYNPKIVECERKQLLDAGLPQSYVKRLE